MSILAHKYIYRDAAALAEFWCWLEGQVRESVPLTEVQVAEKLLEFRQKQDGFIDTSFDTISGIFQLFPAILKSLRTVLHGQYLEFQMLIFVCYCCLLSGLIVCSL